MHFNGTYIAYIRRFDELTRTENNTPLSLVFSELTVIYKLVRTDVVKVMLVVVALMGEVHWCVKLHNKRCKSFPQELFLASIVEHCCTLSASTQLPTCDLEICVSCVDFVHCITYYKRTCN